MSRFLITITHTRSTFRVRLGPPYLLPYRRVPRAYRHLMVHFGRERTYAALFFFLRRTRPHGPCAASMEGPLDPSSSHAQSGAGAQESPRSFVRGPEPCVRKDKRMTPTNSRPWVRSRPMIPTLRRSLPQGEGERRPYRSHSLPPTPTPTPSWTINRE